MVAARSTTADVAIAGHVSVALRFGCGRSPSRRATALSATEARLASSLSTSLTEASTGFIPSTLPIGPGWPRWLGCPPVPVVDRGQLPHGHAGAVSQGPDAVSSQVEKGRDALVIEVLEVLQYQHDTLFGRQVAQQLAGLDRRALHGHSVGVPSLAERDQFVIKGREGPRCQRVVRRQVGPDENACHMGSAPLWCVRGFPVPQLSQHDLLDKVLRLSVVAGEKKCQAAADVRWSRAQRLRRRGLSYQPPGPLTTCTPTPGTRQSSEG